MNKKSSIEIVVVCAIAAAIFASFPLSSAVWIYLVWMIWRKKTNISYDQMEPELAERRLRRVKTLLLVAGISFAMFWVTVFPLRIVLAAIPNQPYQGERVVFCIGFSSVVLFAIATAGGLYIVLKGR